MPLPGRTALGLGVTGTLPTSIHIRHAGHDSRTHMQPHVTRPAVRIAGLLNRCVSTRHACRLTTAAALMAKHTFTESPNGRVYKTSLMTKSVSFFTASLSQLATTWQLASDPSCCQIVPHTFALQVVEVREELQRRNMDDRGTKKILVERLYQVIQQEAEQLKSAQKAAAAEPEPPPKPESRPPRTRAEMGAKLQLRSTSQPAKRARRASRSRRAPAGTSPDPLSGTQALPGASVAQLVRRALLNRIAAAAKQSAQQKQQQQQQQQLRSDYETQPEAPAHQQQQQQQQQLPEADLTPSEPGAASRSQHATDLNSDGHLAGATRSRQAQHPAEPVSDSQADPQQSRQQQAEAARPWQEPDGHASFVLDTNAQQQDSSHAANMHVPSRDANEPAQTAESAPADEARHQQAATPENVQPAGSAVPTPSTSHPDPLVLPSTPPKGDLSEGLLESSPAAVKADIAVTERQGSHAAASSSARTISSSSRSRTGSSAGSVTGLGSGAGMATNVKECHGTCVDACQHAVVSVWSSIQWQRRQLTEAQAYAHSRLTRINSAPAQTSVHASLSTAIYAGSGPGT